MWADCGHTDNETQTEEVGTIKKMEIRAQLTESHYNKHVRQSRERHNPNQKRAIVCEKRRRYFSELYVNVIHLNAI